MPSLPIGHSTVNNETFSISPADRNNHMAIFGVTGVGKTTLMANMIAADLHAGCGVTVLDPHGGLIDEILKIIAAERARDVIYLNPAAAYDQVIGVNLFDAQEQDHQLVVSVLISIFKNLWPDAWGPRSEFILSDLSQAVLSRGGKKTLLIVHKLLTDPLYRQQLAQSAGPFMAYI